MKTSVANFLILALFAPVILLSQYSGGSGTSGNPYLISSTTDLAMLATNVNAGSSYSGVYFQQTANIDFAGASITPIGYFSGRSFAGTYDGAGYTASNFSISSSTSGTGLFGFLSSGTIKNLGVRSATITNSANGTGGLVGWTSAGTIQNCYVFGSTISGYSYVGGLVGCISSSLTITSCYTTGGTVSGHDGIGGLVGVDQGGAINNSYSSSNVTTTYGQMGGLVGWHSTGSSIANCYSNGSVGSGTDVGGLVGYKSATGTSTTNSFWDTQTSGRSSSPAGTGMTTAGMKTLTTFTDAGWDFSTVPLWEMIAGNYPRLKAIPEPGLGCALSFDGASAYVELPGGSAFQPTGGNFSTEAWIYIEEGAGNDQKVLFTLEWGPPRGYAMNVYQDGSGNFYYAASIYLSGDIYWAEDQTKLIPTRTWTHIAMTWNQNGNLTAYLNGLQSAQTSTAASAYSATSSLVTLGCGDGTWAFFKGMIDEVRIWNTTRTQNQIAANMRKELAGNESGLATYYKMNEGSGTTLSDNQTNGSPNDATIVGASRSTGNSPLPVELSSFTTAVVKSGVNLQWSTATEVNNHGFDIERRQVGEASWRKVGFVAGNGTSNSQHTYCFTDNTAAAGRYVYRLKQVDKDGAFKYSSESEVDLGVPSTTALQQNYPNPFNPNTVISYQLSAASKTSLRVYDMLGREVAVLVNEEKPAGSYTVTWNAANMSSGMYLSKITAGTFTQTRMMLLMK
jgi:hypothetical protein